MTPEPTRPLPSTATLLTLLATIFLLALLFNPAKHRHPHDRLPGLTYEVASADHPLALIVTSIEEKGVAARADIVPGDIIDQIDGRPINATGDVKAALQRDRTSGLLLRIRHAGKNSYKRLPAVNGQSG